MSRPPEPVLENVLLAPATTFEIGGPARFFAEVDNHATLCRLLAWAQQTRIDTLVLGGGSNLLVSDRGFDGLVLRLASRAVEIGVAVSDHELAVDAGVGWDALVAFAVEHRLAGLECLSGIPGLVGAAPIQNIGAYGQELAPRLTAVQVVDRQTGAAQHLQKSACGFAYRTSLFRRQWQNRFVITGITLALTPNGQATLAYPELVARLGPSPKNPDLATVREEVLTIRREKSMLAAADDPNRKSAGSFFLNPVVPATLANQIGAKTGESAKMPRYPAPQGQVKLSAAWLIERAGFERGFVRGRAGLSSRHTLAIINRGGAQAADILALARAVRRAVRAAFSIELNVEPVLVGFEAPPPELLD